MAYAHIDLVATAGQQNFAFSIPYLSRDDISVFKNGTLLVFTTNWTFLSAQTVQLNVGAAVNDVIRIKRVTPIDEPIVNYANGSNLGEAELDASAAQVVYAAQEIRDFQDSSLLQNDALEWDALGEKLVNLGSATAATDAVNLSDVVSLFTGGTGAGGTVVTETSFGQAAAVGAAAEYSRADHTHGTPTNPVTAHEAAGDPHTAYQLESEKNAASGYAGLTAGSKIQDNAVVTLSITDANVTKAKIENVATSKLLGHGDGAAGAPQEITLGTNLTMSGTTLNASDTGGIVLATPQAATSGTSRDFTGIPAGVKHIVVEFHGISTNGTSLIQVQLGDAGGFETTGYVNIASTNANYTSTTTGFQMEFNLTAATNTRSGQLILTLLDASTFLWCASGQFSNVAQVASHFTVGSKALSAELTQIRITTVNGTDTFDAGSVNIQYSS